MKSLFCILLLAAAPTVAQVHIVDGDTLDLDGTRYRINGIDAPERAQKCNNARGEKWDCGARSTEALERLVASKQVTCERLATDGFGREIARCFADGQDLAMAMTKLGMAWAFLKFSDEYEAAQISAQSAERGIWQGEAQPAWEYREIKWSGAKQIAPQGCPIKGNISTYGQIYHMPWSRYYSRTRINTAKGERWFCDEAEAIQAGWRPVKQR